MESIVTWVLAHFQLPDKRLARALGELAWALIHAARIGFASIGRCVESGAHPASSIARVYRFCHNARVDPRAVQAALIQLLASRAAQFGKGIAAVAMDWIAYDNGSMAGLRVNLVTGSRAIPLLFYDIHEEDRQERQSELELTALRDLIRYRPPGVKWLVLLDSGFGGPDLFDLLEEVGYYVVRSHTRTLIHANEHCWTLIRDLPVRVGQIVDFGWVHRTAANPRAVRLIAARLYEGEKPKRRNRRSSTKHYKYTIPGLCVVSTNLPTTEFTAITVIRLYARRFEIEHNFRDVKNATLGLDIEHVHLQDAATYSRLMCIVAVAEAASWLFGAEAEARGLQRRFSPCQPRKQRRILSLRHLGRLACHLIQVSVDTLIRRHLGKAIRAALHAVGLTWRDVPDERIVAARALSPAELRPLRKLCRTKEKDGGERCEPGHGWRLLKTQSEPKRAVERLAA